MIHRIVSRLTLTAPPNIQASRLLTACGWCSLHTGHHSSWHRREDLHAISNVRCDLKWRSLQKFVEVSPSFVSVLTLKNHVSAYAGYVPFGTPIVSLMWKSYILIMHFIEVKAAVQTSIYIVMFGDRWNETLDLFCFKISSYSLVSFRSLAFFSQTRQWCLPLYGRYSKAIVKPLHWLFIFNVW